MPPGTWCRFFIVDTSVNYVRRKFGKAFVGFNDSNQELFTTNPYTVKLYETLQEATEDFNKIPFKVAIIQFVINSNGQQAQVQITKVASK